ncbi:MAG: hypothetical protein ACRD3P_00930 [Terriglobales bacterium]
MARTVSIPALRKVREERGTHFVDGANDIKGWGQPPSGILA